MHKPDTIQVRETGHFGEYLVSSLSRPGEWHTVNLCERDGNGLCCCEFFHFKALPAFREQYDAAKAAGEKSPRPFIPYRRGRAGCTECLHIQVANEHFRKHRLRPLFSAFGNHPSAEQFGDALRNLMQWPRQSKRSSPSASDTPGDGTAS